MKKLFPKVRFRYKWWVSAGLCLLLFPAFISGTSPDRRLIHPFYVSVTEIAYNSTEKTLEISCKLFTDDFEKALVKAYAQPVNLYQPKDGALLDKQIGTYIKKHLLCKVDGKDVQLEYVGHELEEQSTFVYFQVNGVGQPPRKLGVNNSILYDMFDKQISIVHATVNNNRKSTKLEYPISDMEFTW